MQYEYGTPGGSVQANFQGTAASGVYGELRTGDLLRAIQGSRRPHERFVVIHDVMLPSDKYTVNIDHIVLAGTQILILDSKTWSSGVYLTIRDKTYVYHGSKTRNEYNKRWSRFEPADHRTLPMIVSVLSQWLRDASISYAHFLPPTLVVWPPAGKKPPSLIFYKPKGNAELLSARNARSILTHKIPYQPPDERLLNQLLELQSG
jgi:hypothetical protein